MGNTVSRFNNGINDTLSGDWNDDLKTLDPLKQITFLEDFADGSNGAFPIAASSLAAASTANWTISVTETGAGSATTALLNLNGGAVVLTTDAADNDTLFVQKVPETILPTAGKKIFFKTRFKITDANGNAASILESEFYFGLMITDSDPLSATLGTGVTDGIFFMKEDGTQAIQFYCQKNTTTGQLATNPAATLTVNTFTTFAFAFDGERYIRLYKDDVYLATADLTATLATYLPDTTLTISFGIKNGEAVIKVMTVDYVFCSVER